MSIQYVKIVVQYDPAKVDPEVEPFNEVELVLKGIPGVVNSYVEVPEPAFQWGSLPESRAG